MLHGEQEWRNKNGKKFNGVKLQFSREKRKFLKTYRHYIVILSKDKNFKFTW